MSQFYKFQKGPLYNKLIAYSSVIVEWESSLAKGKMGLLIDGRDQITGLNYEWNGPKQEIALFEALATMARGRQINEVESIGHLELDQFFGKDEGYLSYRNDLTRPLLTVALQLFYQAIGQYKGKMKTPPRPSELICRCFGVLEHEIIAYLEENRETGLKQLSGDLLAGGGCTNCVQDLNSYIAQYARVGKRLHFKRAQEVMRIYELFCQWRKKEEMDIDIVDLSSEEISIAPLGPLGQQDLLDFQLCLEKEDSVFVKKIKILK